MASLTGVLNWTLVAVGSILCPLGLLLSAYPLIRVSYAEPTRTFLLCLGITLFLVGIATLAALLASWEEGPIEPGVPVTFGAFAALIIVVAWASQAVNTTILAISAGAIGGIVHEIFQSNGSITVPSRLPPKTLSGKPAPTVAGSGDPPGTEVYLGSLTGAILGGVAGVLIVATSSQTGLALGLAAFMAGLALKGVSEAVSTSSTKSS